MSLVTTKKDVFTTDDPRRGSGAEDPWEAFREIEVIDFPLEFPLRHSFGKLSRFFLELENQRLFGTRCPRCGGVWMPPRVVCPEDREVCEWMELPPEGTLEAAVTSAYTRSSSGGSSAPQRVLGYVRLDGASTSIFQRIRNTGNAGDPARGLRVRAVWAEEPVDHPMLLFWFEPVP